MAEKNTLLRLVQPTSGESGSDTSAPQIATPDALTMASTLEMLRDHERQYGAVPNSEITKQRLLNKYAQNPAQRGELGAKSQMEQHPILADYLRGIDNNVNPSLEHMEPDERQQFEQNLQYQQRKRLERQLNLSAAPTLTR